MSVGGREGQPDAQPVVLRLSDLRRNPRLSPLSFAASRTYAAGRRSGSDSFSAVSDHRDKLPPQVRARYHRADRLPAAQGAVAECARAEGMAARTARRAFLGEARSAAWRQRRVVCGPCRRWRVVGLSAAMAVAAAHLADGHY